MEWKYAKIFISSSFIDMHAERDYLIKKVFPELEEWCEEHKIHLSTIDLRWGVPEEVSQNNSTIEKCLLNIDESRPFFLCFLAQRRGWIPDFNKDISEDTKKRYNDIAKYEKRSATEMEIEHALLRPLKDFIEKDDANQPKEYNPATHSLFFIRDKSSLKDITDAQKRVYTNYELVNVEKGEFIPGEYDKDKTFKDRICLKEARIIDNLSDETKKIIKETDEASQNIIEEIKARKSEEDEKGNVNIEITKYTGDWNKNLIIPEIEPIDRFNDNEWIGRLTNFKEIKEDYKDINLLEETKDINSKLGKPLKDVIIAQLKEQLKLEFPENFEEDENLPEEKRILQNELNQQDNFAHINSEGYIERKEDVDKLIKYIEDSNENKICLVSSEAGYGKTMLLANFATLLEKKYTNKFNSNTENQKNIYKRFCGASDLSSKAFPLWDSIIKESGIEEDEDFTFPSNIDELKKSIPAILKKISSRGDSVIIIDAVNQMPDGLEMLKWLPAPESSNLKIIISCKEDRADEEYNKKFNIIKDRNAFCDYFKEGETLGDDYKNYSFELKAWESDEKKTEIIQSYLKNYLKELSPGDIETICGFEASKNPLFLKILLAELRVFASFEKLRKEIQEFIKDEFGDTKEGETNIGSPKTAFNHVLERLENDEDLNEGEPLVPLIFSLLANARSGLSKDELTSIIQAQTGLDEEYISDTVNVNLRQVKPFMARKEGRDDFFYESFKLAAQDRYSDNYIQKNERLTQFFSDKKASNELLADYFLKDAIGSDSQDYKFKGNNIRSYNELPYHLNEARDFDRLEKVLSSYSFIKNKLNLTNINNLIVDYQFKDFDDMEHRFLEGESDHPIVLIGRALELSAPILTDKKEELANQLYGRMIDLREDEIIKPIIDEIENEDSSDMLLKPKSNSLYSPKSSIIKRPKVNGTKSTSAIHVTEDKLLILANADGTLNLFDFENNDLEILEEPDLSSNSNIIKIIPTDDNKNMLIASNSGQINKWDINNRSIFKGDEYKYPKIGAEITDIYLSNTYEKIYVSSHSGIFSIDLNTKELRKEDIEAKNYNQILVPRRNEAILVCDEKEVDGWDVYEMRKAYNKHHQQNDDDDSSTKIDTSEEIRFMGLNKRFLTLISENGQMKFWNTLKNSGGGESIDEAQVCSPNDKFTQAKTLEDENEIITISDMGVLRVWDIPQPRSPKFKIVKDIQTGIKSPTSIDYHNDGTDRWVIVGNENNDISVIDLNKEIEEDESIRHAESVLSIKIDDNHMITASDNGEIFTWNLDNEQFINRYSNDFRCNSVSYNREDKKLVFAGVKAEKDGRKTYKIADCNIADEMWEAKDMENNEAIPLEVDEKINSEEIIDIAQNSSGIVFLEKNKLVIGSDETKLDKVATTLTTKFDSNEVFVGFEDGSIVKYPGEVSFDKPVQSEVTKIKITDDDKLIAGYEDGSLELFSLEGTHNSADGLKHEKAVTNIEIISNSEIATVSEDNTLKFWDIETGKCTYTYFLDIYATAINIDGDKLVVGDALGNVRFFSF